MPVVESLLLTVARISTFNQDQHKTNATGFYFQRAGRLFLVTSRHVMIDRPTDHHPDRIEIDLHTDSDNLAESTPFSIPLYKDRKSIWRQAEDAAGEIDAAVIEIDRQALPSKATFRAFTPEHLVEPNGDVEVGSNLLVVGFPLNFQDTLHRMPVARHAIIASSFGLRFGGNGYFLTDARTHRGISGAPVVMRMVDPGANVQELPWRLLGIHSARIDVGTRDVQLDEALGLNCAWYADVLMTLTEG